MKKQFSKEEPQMTIMHFEMFLISLGTRGIGTKTVRQVWQSEGYHLGL